MSDLLTSFDKDGFFRPGTIVQDRMNNIGMILYHESGSFETDDPAYRIYGVYMPNAESDIIREYRAPGLSEIKTHLCIIHDMSTWYYVNAVLNRK